MIERNDFWEALNECKQRWPQIEKQIEVYYSHLSFMDFKAFQDICQRFVEDFRSMPLPKDFKEAYSEWKGKNYLNAPDKRDEFIILPGVNCRSCGRKNVMCIQEPIGSEWECRECYTGMTNQQIKARFKEITASIGKSHDVCDDVPF